MSLISIFRDSDFLYCVSDSASKAFYKIGICYEPIATKIHLYENKFVIQHCGIGTLNSKYVQEHIDNFIRVNKEKSLFELPQLLLEYFEQFKDCSEMKKFPEENDIILTVSGWETGKSFVYKVSTKDNAVTLVNDDLISYGVGTSEYKKYFHQHCQISNNPLFSMLTSFAEITIALKTFELLNGITPTEENVIKIQSNPSFQKVHVAVDAPYDFIEISRGGKYQTQIATNKTQKWLDEE